MLAGYLGLLLLAIHLRRDRSFASRSPRNQIIAA